MIGLLNYDNERGLDVLNGSDSFGEWVSSWKDYLLGGWKFEAITEYVEEGGEHLCH